MNGDNFRDKLDDYLSLFGLTEDSTIEELSTSFRILAKLNHPDVCKDVDSEERMTIINEGYKFLKNAFLSEELSSLREEKKEDIFYTQYKKAFLIFKNAFECYFGEGEDKSSVGDEKTLKENLQLAKREFSKLVNELPYNKWLDDAIDKISSINKWLY